MRHGRRDREAFALLFDREVDAVFAAAREVVHDPALAAELTVRTFAGAWARKEREGLVDAARERAELRVLENGPVGPDTEAPGLLPVRRARIVADLELQGIPTPAGPAGPASGAPDPAAGARQRGPGGAWSAQLRRLSPSGA